MNATVIYNLIIHNITKNYKKKIVPYSIYLKTEIKRDKNKRRQAIKDWYDHIQK
jgi:hypothetical protein